MRAGCCDRMQRVAWLCHCHEGAVLAHTPVATGVLGLPSALWDTLPGSSTTSTGADP